LQQKTGYAGNGGNAHRKPNAGAAQAVTAFVTCSCFAQVTRKPVSSLGCYRVTAVTCFLLVPMRTSLKAPHDSRHPLGLRKVS
jgi:hypothetical protein